MPPRSHVVLETDRKRRRFLGPVFLFIRFLDEGLAHVLSLPCDERGNGLFYEHAKGDERGDKDHIGDVPAANEGYHSWTRSIELSPRAVRNHSPEFRRTFIVFTALTARHDAGGSEEQATIFRAPGVSFSDNNAHQCVMAEEAGFESVAGGGQAARSQIFRRESALNGKSGRIRLPIHW